ncbi:MAG TPA: hypothetical protein VGR70_12325, partial [Stellaceae bacterium]|nr:hypothetical protein [Stellaceae bacterium]
LLRECYSDPSFGVLELKDLDAPDWERFEATMRPNADAARPLGHYAVETRKRLRGASRDSGSGVDGDAHQDKGYAESRAGAHTPSGHGPSEQGCPYRPK